MRENLTPKQRRAIEALLTTGDVTQAAQVAKVSRETIYQWMKRAPFRTALSEGTQQALESLSRTLVGLGDKAVKTLEDALNDTDAVISIRVRTADLVLGRLMQLRELIDLEERVSRLEAHNESKP